MIAMRLSERSTLGLRVVLSATIAAALFVPARAGAQSIDLPAVLTSESDKDSWVYSSYAHLFQSDIDDGGNVQRESLAAGLGHRFGLSDDWSLITSAFYQGSYYDFSSAASPFAWDLIHQVTGLGLVNWTLNEHWSLQGGGIARVAAESGGDFGDGHHGRRATRL